MKSFSRQVERWPNQILQGIRPGRPNKNGTLLISQVHHDSGMRRSCDSTDQVQYCVPICQGPTVWLTRGQNCDIIILVSQGFNLEMCSQHYPTITFEFVQVPLEQGLRRNSRRASIQDGRIRLVTATIYVGNP